MTRKRKKMDGSSYCCLSLYIPLSCSCGLGHWCTSVAVLHLILEYGCWTSWTRSSCTFLFWCCKDKKTTLSCFRLFDLVIIEKELPFFRVTVKDSKSRARCGAASKFFLNCLLFDRENYSQLVSKSMITNPKGLLLPKNEKERGNPSGILMSMFTIFLQLYPAFSVASQGKAPQILPSSLLQQSLSKISK